MKSSSDCVGFGGGPGVAIAVGSRVLRRGEVGEQLYVVKHVFRSGLCNLFVDEGPRRYETVRGVALGDLAHVAHDINVHQIRGVAGTECTLVWETIGGTAPAADSPIQVRPAGLGAPCVLSYRCSEEEKWPSASIGPTRDTYHTLW